MKTLEQRMEYTYSRTFVTVLNTSATTFLAFVATASAPIMPIASFGVFAAFAIIFNWVLTVTWWPCAVMVWELYFCRAGCIGCCFSCEVCREAAAAGSNTTILLLLLLTSHLAPPPLAPPPLSPTTGLLQLAMQD